MLEIDANDRHVEIPSQNDEGTLSIYTGPAYTETGEGEIHIFLQSWASIDVVLTTEEWQQVKNHVDQQIARQNEK